jgi:hypothetical protein
MGSVLKYAEEEKQYDMRAMVDSIVEEIGAPYMTIPTTTYAKLCAAIEFLGGTALDVIGDAPYHAGLSLEPEYASDPVEPAVAKASKVLAWGDNGLNATDKQTYELLLHMTKTTPGAEQPYVRVTIGAIAKRLDVTEKTASTALWGLADTGLIDAVHRSDPTTGYKLVYARAGKMPQWGERYAENTHRARDAERKRGCRGCGGEHFALRYICKDCGLVQDTPPFKDELQEAIQTADPTEPSVKFTDCSIEDQSVTDTVQEPSVDSTDGVLLQEIQPRIYHIGPRIADPAKDPLMYRPLAHVPGDPRACKCGATHVSLRCGAP